MGGGGAYFRPLLGDVGLIGEWNYKEKGAKKNVFIRN